MKRPLEKDIEAAFVEEMKTWRHVYKNQRMVTWVERQVTMPFEGRADIVSTGHRQTIVVEVKRGKLRGTALTQLLGYMGQLNTALRWRMSGQHSIAYDPSQNVKGVLVGSDYSPMLIRAARGLRNLEIYRYRVDGGQIKFDWVNTILGWCRDYCHESRFLQACIENGVDHMLEAQDDINEIYGELPY